MERESQVCRYRSQRLPFQSLTSISQRYASLVVLVRIRYKIRSPIGVHTSCFSPGNLQSDRRDPEDGS
jgi:hypothetical protein